MEYSFEAAQATFYIDIDETGGRIQTTNLKTYEKEDEFYDAAMDVIESIVLAHACAGVDVRDHKYIEGLKTAIEACANNIPENEE